MSYGFKWKPTLIMVLPHAVHLIQQEAACSSRFFSPTLKTKQNKKEIIQKHAEIKFDCQNEGRWIPNDKHISLHTN